MKLRFTRRASQDLDDISSYLRARSSGGARRVRAAIIATLQNVMLFPKAGRCQHIEGVRKLATRRYPYLIYYSVDEATETIVVITIQHAARQREFADF
jgi:plasmid stabilization system protein ParE